MLFCQIGSDGEVVIIVSVLSSGVTSISSCVEFSCVAGSDIERVSIVLVVLRGFSQSGIVSSDFSASVFVSEVGGVIVSSSSVSVLRGSIRTDGDISGTTVSRGSCGVGGTIIFVMSPDALDVFTQNSLFGAEPFVCAIESIRKS